MHWFINPIKNHYADFSGRATRREYWMFMLVYLLISFVVALGFGMSVALVSDSIFLPGLALIVLAAIGITIPAIAMQIRRLHDIGRSGWWYFLGFIPYIGGIVLLAMSALPSEPGTNAYGQNIYEALAESKPTTPLSA